ncbi:MAG: nucleoside triphosphate pyrophosphatase [Pseudomonadota bacterium]
MTDPATRPLVLASTSPYRAELLGRLGLPFSQVAPDVDEAPQPEEAPADLARRLGAAKARVVAATAGDSVVIGSDQVAVIDGKPVGKPGDDATACAQLRAASGRDVSFLTAVTVCAPDQALHYLDVTRVAFRHLGDDEIRRYVAAEQPLNCAGSFKAEGLGIALFEQIEARDPTGLIGLPLIWLADALRRCGYRLP